MNIFFDLDGTVIDTSDRNYAVYKKIVLQLKGKPLPKNIYWKLKRAKKDISNILKLSRIDQSKHSIYNEQFLDNIEKEKYIKLDKLFPFTAKTLDDLNKLRNNLFLVSYRRDQNTTHKEIVHFGLEKKFQKIRVGRIKKSGHLTKVEFLKQFGGGRGDIIVGDTEDEISVAKKLGLICISVLSGIRNRNFLQFCGSKRIIKNISLLPGLIKDGLLQKN